MNEGPERDRVTSQIPWLLGGGRGIGDRSMFDKHRAACLLGPSHATGKVLADSRGSVTFPREVSLCR